MYHSLSITVDGVSKNTYTDWHLVPKARPVFNPPKPKTHYIDIPGGDGSIDLTDTLAGRPVYANREGDIEFYVLNNYAMEGPSTYNWMDVYTSIMQFLHGKKAMIILEDEPTHYYLGRLTVDSWTTNNDWSTISISYSLEPYKYLIDPVSYTLANGTIAINTGSVVATDLAAYTSEKLELKKGDVITMVRSKETPVTYNDITSTLTRETGGFSGEIGQPISLSTSTTWQRISFTPIPGQRYRIRTKTKYMTSLIGYIRMVDAQDIVVGRTLDIPANDGGTVETITLSFDSNVQTVWVRVESGKTLTVEEVNGGPFNMLGPSDHLSSVLFYGSTSSSSYPGMAEGYVHSYPRGGNEYIVEKDGYYRFVLVKWDNSAIDAAYRDILKQEVLIKKGGVL